MKAHRFLIATASTSMLALSLSTASAHPGHEHESADEVSSSRIWTIADTGAHLHGTFVAVKEGTEDSKVQIRGEHGQLVMLSTRSEIWRFEESEPNTWRRIPEGRQPLLLLRQ